MIPAVSSSQFFRCNRQFSSKHQKIDDTFASPLMQLTAKMFRMAVDLCVFSKQSLLELLCVCVRVCVYVELFKGLARSEGWMEKRDR